MASRNTRTTERRRGLVSPLRIQPKPQFLHSSRILYLFIIVSFILNEPNGAPQSICFDLSHSIPPALLQCCYDQHGMLLVDITHGGGSINRVDTRGLLSSGLLEHREEDVEPFEWCCESVESWHCRQCASSMRSRQGSRPHALDFHMLKKSRAFARQS